MISFKPGKRHGINNLIMRLVYHLKRLDHGLFGCWTRRGVVGNEYGIYEQKKNKPPEITKKKHDFYQCDFCGGYNLKQQIRIIKGDKNEQ